MRVLIGAIGGLLVVLINVLLQHRLAIMAMMVLLGLTTSALVGLRTIFGFAPLPIVSVAHGCDDPSWDGP